MLALPQFSLLSTPAAVSDLGWSREYRNLSSSQIFFTLYSSSCLGPKLEQREKKSQLFPIFLYSLLQLLSRTWAGVETEEILALPKFSSLSTPAPVSDLGWSRE